ncbi:MAG TPA: phage baseplate assembly protein V [Anaerolineales bacterium]|nr:phage baseplate assembly protein V [Anaerolineales bacterium]
MMNEELMTHLVEEVQHRFYGKYRAKVSDNSDPLNRGRLRVKVPEVLGDVESGWAVPCAPYAGADKGWFVIPETDDVVWVEFEAGDPSRPIWVGSWYGDGDLPNDPSGSQATTQTKIFKSQSGLIIDLDDSATEIKISDSSGSNLLDIQVNAGKIVVKATTNVTVDAPLINLVDSSTHPLVFGDDLLQYLNQLVQMFNTHMHPGELAVGVLPVTPAPPVPPFPPATPSLLSTKVMTG